MGFAAAIIGIVGVAISAYSAIEAGQAQEAAGRANQKILKQQALFAQQAADVAQNQAREHTRRVQGTAAANIGASGVQMEGSPLLTLIDNAQQGELQARIIDASGKRVGAGDIARGQLAAWEGAQAARAGYLKAGATVLTGASRLNTASGEGSSLGNFQGV